MAVVAVHQVALQLLQRSSCLCCGALFSWMDLNVFYDGELSCQMLQISCHRVHRHKVGCCSDEQGVLSDFLHKKTACGRLHTQISSLFHLKLNQQDIWYLYYHGNRFASVGRKGCKGFGLRVRESKADFTSTQQTPDVKKRILNRRETLQTKQKRL